MILAIVTITCTTCQEELANIPWPQPALSLPNYHIGNRLYDLLNEHQADCPAQLPSRLPPA